LIDNISDEKMRHEIAPSRNWEIKVLSHRAAIQAVVSHSLNLGKSKLTELIGSL
jgi:hypothetical protein